MNLLIVYVGGIIVDVTHSGYGYNIKKLAKFCTLIKLTDADIATLRFHKKNQ